MHFVSESNRGGSAAGDGTAPVLFLDVDGVLTTSRGLLMTYSPGDDTLYHVSDLLPGAAQDSISPLDKDRVANLKTVIDSVPGLRIVVSSTWREDPAYMAFLLAALRAGGIDTETVVIDSTPVDSGGRGVEVRDWLLMHPSHDMYCIVDDGHTESFEQCGFMPRLVQTYIGCSTDEYEGLTRVHAQSLVDLFTIPGEICSEDVTVNPAESPDLVS